MPLWVGKGIFQVVFELATFRYPVVVGAGSGLEAQVEGVAVVQGPVTEVDEFPRPVGEEAVDADFALRVDVGVAADDVIGILA